MNLMYYLNRRSIFHVGSHTSIVFVLRIHVAMSLAPEVTIRVGGKGIVGCAEQSFGWSHPTGS